MAEAVLLVTKERTSRGSSEARRLRKKGQVPGVVYGHKEATLSIMLSAEELSRTIKHGVRVVDLDAGGKVEKALIREVQWDPLGHDILHVDFARVSADERIEVEVRIELRGAAPGVTAGGVVDQPIHNLVVECLAIAIPDSIRVSIAELQMDQAIKVKDLKLPEGVVSKMDPEAIIVHVRQPLIEAEPVVAAVPGATPEAAEPEVIGRQAKPEEGEEEEKEKEKEKKPEKK